MTYGFFPDQGQEGNGSRHLHTQKKQHSVCPKPVLGSTGGSPQHLLPVMGVRALADPESSSGTKRSLSQIFPCRTAAAKASTEHLSCLSLPSQVTLGRHGGLAVVSSCKGFVSCARDEAQNQQSLLVVEPMLLRRQKNI